MLNRIIYSKIVLLMLLLTTQHSYCFDFKISARNYISIVGSSTVYPFVSVVSEEFGRNQKLLHEDARTPVVESTGTGGGFKLFCSGIGLKYPDFVNASRKIKESEFEQCKKNKIYPENIVEMKIGYDVIVIANSHKGQDLELTKEEIFKALAKKIYEPREKRLVDNYYNKWSEINKNLPDIEIKVYGPPFTSGTRDAFVELVMLDYCMKDEGFVKFFPNKKQREYNCGLIRSDGRFIEAGENDNLIVQKLKNDENAFGIFGFSFVRENMNLLKPVKIDGSYPEYNEILKNNYKLSRPLFVYFKKNHIDKIKYTKEFIQELLSEEAIGKDGYLIYKGLIPLTSEELSEVQAEIFKELEI